MNTSDRELLEKAARAAGVDWSGAYRCYVNADGAPWRPLTDDGDAQRLATKLSLCVYAKPEQGYATAFSYEVCAARHDITNATNINAAVRECIVRAAAALAKATP